MTLPDSNGYSLAATFKAAGDPMRLEILRIMERDSFGVLELCKIFAVQQPSMSHHLKVLAKAGLVATRREGNSIFYFRGGSGNRFVQKSLNQFFDLVDQTELPQSRREALEAIRIARQAQAAELQNIVQAYMLCPMGRQLLPSLKKQKTHRRNSEEKT